MMCIAKIGYYYTVQNLFGEVPVHASGVIMMHHAGLATIDRQKKIE